jgi:hypothetical protein
LSPPKNTHKKQQQNESNADNKIWRVNTMSGFLPITSHSQAMCYLGFRMNRIYATATTDSLDLFRNSWANTKEALHRQGVNRIGSMEVHSLSPPTSTEEMIRYKKLFVPLARKSFSRSLNNMLNFKEHLLACTAMERLEWRHLETHADEGIIDRKAVREVGDVATELIGRDIGTNIMEIAEQAKQIDPESVNTPTKKQLIALQKHIDDPSQPPKKAAITLFKNLDLNLDPLNSSPATVDDIIEQRAHLLGTLQNKLGYAIFVDMLNSDTPEFTLDDALALYEIGYIPSPIYKAMLITDITMERLTRQKEGESMVVGSFDEAARWFERQIDAVRKKTTN